jgi:hypothetical protein
MNRAILLPTIAALASGCVITSPDSLPPICNAPNLNLYWTPSPSPPQGGFQVPGLPVPGWPAQLGCAQAGVASVRITVGGALLGCSGGSTYCVDANTWRCEFPVGGVIEGGITVPLNAGGTYAVRIEAFDANGNPKYTTQAAGGADVLVSAADCGDTSAGIFPQGLPGTLSLDYVFTPTAQCAAGSNIEWRLLQGGTVIQDSATPCGGPNPFLLAGGAELPAGVYSFGRVAEVIPGTGPGTGTVHAYCPTTPGYQAFVHAGPEIMPVDIPVATAICF